LHFPGLLDKTALLIGHCSGAAEEDCWTILV
jgi:hypothetical protein